MRRGLILALAGIGLAALGAGSAGLTPVRLIWNASASVPIGFYLIRDMDRPLRGDLVAVMPPPEIAGFITERGYTTPGVPLLKQVIGLPGQRVCRIGVRIMLDGLYQGDALARDRFGRAMPVWQGCQIIAPGELFLMNRDAPDSLDGRYFGVWPQDQIIGRAVPISVPPPRDGHVSALSGGQSSPPLILKENSHEPDWQFPARGRRL